MTNETSKKPSIRNQATRAAATQKPAGFTVLLGEGDGIEPYKDGQTLSLERHIGDYFRQLVATVRLDLADKVNKATDAQVCAVVQAANVDDLGDDETENGRRMNAVIEADFMLHGSEDIPNVLDNKLPMSGSNVALAVRLGQMISDDTAKGFTVALEAEKDKDAGPIVAAANIMADYAKESDGNGVSILLQVPPIGTKYRVNAKGNKPPFGYRHPGERNLAENDPRSKLPIYNGPWDYSESENRSGIGPDKIPSHWVAEWVAAKIGKVWAERVGHIKARLADATKEGCPKDLAEMTDKAKLNAELDEASFQFNKRVGIAGKAFKLIEKRRQIAERFKGIRVELYGELEYGETAAVAARRRKPFSFVTETDLGNGRVKETYSVPVAMSKIANLEPAKFPPNSTVATLTAKKPRGTKAGAEGNKEQPGAMVAEITTTDKLEQYLSAVSNYADKAENLSAIRKKIASPENAGKLASDICGTFDLLASLVNENVRTLAKAFEDAAENKRASEAKADSKAAA